MMNDKITVQVEGALLDQVLVGAFGYSGQSVVEETLSLNPNLHPSGPVLPLGAVIVLPERPVTDAQREQAETVSLFD